ncbi:MAG: elongation factor P hydroxylase [Saccharospirillum sp.]|nr:elongation factor P hydroxylase [Saccharospirillum sp.]
MIQRLPKAQWEPGVAELLDGLNPWLVAHWRTQLVAGAGEPVYLPSQVDEQPHRIVFAHGYFSSALHELAHWSLAGEQRRQLEDFGYWYCPDGRTAQQQAEFERVEVKPQALEWWYSLVCGRSFRISLDNLAGARTDCRPFQRAVQAQALSWAQQGLLARPKALVNHLSQRFCRPLPNAASFSELPSA